MKKKIDAIPRFLRNILRTLLNPDTRQLEQHKMQKNSWNDTMLVRLRCELCLKLNTSMELSFFMHFCFLFHYCIKMDLLNVFSCLLVMSVIDVYVWMVLFLICNNIAYNILYPIKVHGYVCVCCWYSDC